MANTDRDRAYLMAQGAWRKFGHTSEPEEAFAARIADIAFERGLSAAAEAIAQDCREHGLEMSAQRVLKSLASDLQHGGQPGPHRIPPGVQSMLDSTRPSGSADVINGLGCLTMLIIVAVLLVMVWNWLF